MALKDVLDGFDRLSDALRDLNISRSIRDAKQKVDELQTNEEVSEIQRIKAQRAIAQAAGARVAELGGNAFSVQQAMASLQPQQVDTQLAQLEATGEPTIAGAVKSLEDKKRARELEDKAEQQRMKLEQIKATGEETRKTAEEKPVKFKGLFAAEAKDINKARTIGQSLSQMEQLVQGMGDAEFVSPQAFSRNRRLFESIKVNAQDIITRLRTGAALNNQEIAFYNDLLSGTLSSGQRIDKQRFLDHMNILKAQFENEHNNTLQSAILEKRIPADAALGFVKAGEESFNTSSEGLRRVIGETYGVPVEGATKSQSSPLSQPQQLNIPGLTIKRK